MTIYGYFRLDPAKSVNSAGDKIKYKSYLQVAYPNFTPVDEPYKGYNHKRPEFDKTEKKLKSGDVFVVYYLSHLSQNYFWASDCIYRVLSTGADFRAIAAEIDTTRMNANAKQVFTDGINQLRALKLPGSRTAGLPLSVFDNGGDGGGNGGM